MITDSISDSYRRDCEKSGGVSMDDSSVVQSMGWEMVKKFHLNPPTIQLPREESVIKKYKENMLIIKMTYTVPEYLMKKYFSSGNKIVLTANDYPYYTTSNVLHYLLWIHPSVHVEDTSVRNMISSKMPSNITYQDFIYFENHGNNKSILDIRHFHVFINTH